MSRLPATRQSPSAMRWTAGVALRIEPGASDTARNELLRTGKVDFGVVDIGGSVAAQEGVFDFAAPDWGPQMVRVVLEDNGEPIDYAVAVAGDAGAKTYADLKGMRVAWYAEHPVVNVNTEAYLAYGGLTWDDVQRVEVHGFFADAMQALAEGRLDAAFGATSDPASFAAAAGPRGLFWPEIDEANADGLNRMMAVAPYFTTFAVTEGAAIDPKVGEHSAHYPYPTWSPWPAPTRTLSTAWRGHWWNSTRNTPTTPSASMVGSSNCRTSSGSFPITTARWPISGSSASGPSSRGPQQKADRTAAGARLGLAGAQGGEPCRLGEGLGRAPPTGPRGRRHPGRVLISEPDIRSQF